MAKLKAPAQKILAYKFSLTLLNRERMYLPRVPSFIVFSISFTMRVMKIMKMIVSTIPARINRNPPMFPKKLVDLYPF